MTALYIIFGVSALMLCCAIANMCRRDACTYGLGRVRSLLCIYVVVGTAVTSQRELRLRSREELALESTQRKERRLQSSIQRLRAALSRKENDLRHTSDTAALLTARLDTARDPEAAMRANQVRHPLRRPMRPMHHPPMHQPDHLRLTNDWPLLARQKFEEDKALFDERGRSVYGEAWDEGLEGGLPLRSVCFGLNLFVCFFSFLCLPLPHAQAWYAGTCF